MLRRSQRQKGFVSDSEDMFRSFLFRNFSFLLQFLPVDTERIDSME